MSLSDNFFCFSASFRLRLSSSRRFLFSSSLCLFFSSSLLRRSSLFSSLILCKSNVPRKKRFLPLSKVFWGSLFIYRHIFFLACFSIFLFLMYSRSGVVRLATENKTKNRQWITYTCYIWCLKTIICAYRYLWALWFWLLSLPAEFQDWP